MHGLMTYLRISFHRLDFLKFREKYSSVIIRLVKIKCDGIQNTEYGVRIRMQKASIRRSTLYREIAELCVCGAM